MTSVNGKNQCEHSSGRWKRIWLGMAAVVTTAGLAGCGTTVHTNFTSTPSRIGTARTQQIRAVAAEDQYASVIKQIGGPYVAVTGIMKNPNTDPHTYEANTTDAALVGAATLVVQNGLGYDDFMNQLEAASPNPNRTVIDVAQSLGYGPKTRNPHLWYDPQTMPRVAQLVVAALSKQDPSQAKYFQDNMKKFNQSMQVLDQSLSDLKTSFRNTPVAVTEPVCDYLLQAAGLDIKTPWAFQAAVMNGVDPAPQSVQTVDNLIQHHQVKVLLYNQQAVDTVTMALLTRAKQSHVPVVGVYETMPPNLTYQRWMEIEVQDLRNAIENGTSTETIK